MYTGSLPPVSNRAHWPMDISLSDSSGNAIDLSDASIEVYVSQSDSNSAVLTFTTSNGRVTISNNVASFVATPAEMGTLCEGRYGCFIRITKTGLVTQLLAAELPVIFGGPAGA